VFVLALASVSSPAAVAAADAPVSAPAQTPASRAPARSGRTDIRLFELASARRLFHTLARRGDAMTEGERAAALADFSVMTEAVVGGVPGGPFTFDELTRAAATADGPRVSASSGVAGRDEAAY
jgi:hypothetical protein